MRIPRKDTTRFVAEVAAHCMSSRQDRANRSAFFESYAQIGSDDPSMPAMYNKIFASLDDLESLLFSPASLRFHIGDPDIPNILNEAKGRAAASKIRQMCRQSESDTIISQAVGCGLVKGIGITKQLVSGGSLSTHIVEPESFGVLRENHTRLDKDMEAFNHQMLITKHQFSRLIAGLPDEHEMRRRAHSYMKRSAGGMTDTQGSAMNIVVGGIQPFQAAGNGTSARGLVDWMSQPKASLDPAVENELLELNETWIWDDQRDDWATFQSIGSDILILGRYSLINAMAYDPSGRIAAPSLQGSHPFTPFCPNPVRNYFWGSSEVAKLVLLQEAINARIRGTNKLLRKQEDPSRTFVGSNGVNQNALARLSKPGGYYSDSNPNAKINVETVTVPQDLWASLHEYERMFDELMGLPPIAKGQGDAGVRSADHAEALIRMFSPRFKDRALLIERDVENFGSLTLDLAKAHVARKMIAWVPKGAAGAEHVEDEAEKELLVPPAPGMVPVYFTFADLPDDLSLTVDSHSSSPAFSSDAKSLVFDMLKTGMMSPADAVDHLDAPDPDALQAGIARRDIAKAEAIKKEQDIKMQTHAHGKK